jgi:two-component system, cell cycle sensor histidine kinase and response regulator CckA
MNILIVEDHEESRYLLESLLKGNGHGVHWAANGADAMAMLATIPIDLIVSDILMPVMDGFAFCRKVKQDEKLRTIPFIFYTATYTGPQDEALALKLGADRFLVKPCEPEAFMQAMDAVLGAAVRRKADTAAAPAPTDTETVFKLYNERLIRKLEQKMLEAEREIVARQAAEGALLESRERLITAQRIAKMGDFTWHIESGAVTWSDAMFDLLAYEKSECFDYTRINREIHHPEDLPQITAWLQACIASGEIQHGPKEYRLVRKDGKILYVQALVAVRYRQGKPAEIFGTIQDISERRKLEEQLRQAQKMESVGRLAGGVAHDFNNMLSVILGYTEMALAKTAPDHPLRENLKGIYQAALRSAEITQQLLAFARRQTIMPIVLDLNTCVESLLNMLRRLIGENITLAWLPGPGLWPVRMDPSQLNQILANLVVNARDAIGDIGQISIETVNVCFDEADGAAHPGIEPGAYALLMVSDDGHGMAKAVLDHLFEPFFTTKKMGKGTGLGLATVYGIVQQNEGAINVYSEPDRGTTFKIYLPRHAGQAASASPPEAEEIPRSRGETLLVVEDEEEILTLTRKILEIMEYRVLIAGSPEAAIALAGRHEGPIDLLISDVVLPEMNGRELAEKVRALHPEAKCLFMSGYTADLIAHRGVLDQGVHFLQKPFSTRDLAFKVRQVLDHDDCKKDLSN